MDKDKLLSDALGQIEKQFGEGSIMRLGDASSMQIETISTGSIALDLALGVGGVLVDELQKSMAPSLQARPLLRFTLSQRPKRTAASVPSSTQSTH